MRRSLVRWLGATTALAILIIGSGCTRAPEAAPPTTGTGLHRTGEVAVAGDREYLLTHQIVEAPNRNGFEVLEVKVEIVDYSGQDSVLPEVTLFAAGEDGSPRVAPIDRETGAAGYVGSGAPPFWESNRWNTREASPKSWAVAKAAFTLREGETGVRVTARSEDGRSETWLIR
jgi:hypothetical protein